MVTIRAGKKVYRSFENGLDDSTPISSPDIEGTLSVAKNCEFVDNDILRTRQGLEAQTTGASGYIVREAFEFTKIDGSKEQVIYLVSITTTGSSGKLCRVSGTSYVDIKTSLNDADKPCLIQAGTLLFVFTGKQSFVYDGTTTRDIGITAPTEAPWTSGSITRSNGGLNSNGSYLYCYTYYNSVTGAESSPSPPSVTMTPQEGNGIIVHVGIGDSTLADTVKLYRTVSGGNIFFLESDYSLGTTRIESIKADSALGDELELDNERIPEHPKYAILHDNRIFITGFGSNPNRVCYSKIGLTGSMYESFQAADFTDCNINDGDKILGLGIIGSNVGILKENSVGKFLPLELSVGGLERQGSTKYIYREISREMTGCNHHTIFNINGIMGWLGKDNIYVTDGSDVFRMGNRIRNLIRSLNFVQGYKFQTIIYPINQQVILSVVQSGHTEPDFQIVGHYKRWPVVAFTTFCPGTDTSTHPGIPSACFWLKVGTTQKELYIGSSNSDGKIYKYGIGESDYTYGIYFDVRLHWEGGNDPINMKGFQEYDVLASTSGVSPNNIITHTWEEDGYESIVKTATSTISVSTKWGSAKWGAFKWAGKSYTHCKFFPNRKALLGRYGFSNTVADTPIYVKAIRGIIRSTPE